MMIRKKHIYFLILLFFLESSNPGAAAPLIQKQPKTPQETLQHESFVTLKLVQVYVTDSKGNPVRDLEISDFILYDNGQLQNITDFEKHFMSVPESTLVESTPPPAREISLIMNRKFFFLIDYESNDPEGVSRSKVAALEFINTQAGPNDEIALLSYGFMRGLVLHEYLTADHEKVRAAIKKIRRVPGVYIGEDTGESLGPSVKGMEADIISGTRTFTEQRAASIRFSMKIRELAEALRHIPGQKNIILFSRGYGTGVLIPGTPTADAFLAMSRELASANCPVFTVHTITRKENKHVRHENALYHLSQETGGKYYHDVYPSSIAEDIQSATSNYYILGYSVESSWDGKFHNIKVEVKREGYRVHAQRGYYNPVPFNQFSPLEKHFHLLALALGEKAHFEQHLIFPLTGLPFSGQNGLNTMLISEIPVLRLRELIGDNTELISLIFDENKNIVESNRMEINWGKNDEEKIFQYSTAALAPGQYDCRVVIRNLNDGKGAVGACRIEIPEIEAAGETLKLYPPLLLIPGQEGRYLHVYNPDKENVSERLSLFQVFPIQSKEYIPLAGEMQPGMRFLNAVLKCKWTNDKEPEIQISAWIELQETGQKIPLSCIIQRRTRQEEAFVFIIKIDVADLKPGSYRLHLIAEDRATGLSSQTASEFSVGTPAPPEKIKNIWGRLTHLPNFFK